jgi:hypothetical protein
MPWSAPSDAASELPSKHRLLGKPFLRSREEIMGERAVDKQLVGKIGHTGAFPQN